MVNIEDPDRNFALLLQYELDSEFARYEHNVTKKAGINNLNAASTDDYLNSSKGIIDPNWELVDPTPNIVNLFVAFNEKYFWSKLATVCVVWSKRMTSCAGICSYEGRGGLCKIALSEPLLKLRPRKDLVETLLHEMIHAFLFVANNNRDRDGHGPEFHKHMHRINLSAGTKISVYHSFHDEVRLYQQHWWRCDGPCQQRHPFFGMVRRSINRAPGPNDNWYDNHQRNCGGKFIKIKEPDKKPTAKEKALTRNLGDIRKYLTKTSEIPILTSKISPHTTANVIHGFHDLNSQEKSKHPVKSLNNNTTIINPNANIVGFINKNVKSINNHKTPTKTKLNKHSTPNGNNNTQINYDLVRNYWINKYANNTPSKRLLNDDEKHFDVAKKLKTTPTNKITCPVCSEQFRESEINNHIDACLNIPQTTEKCKHCDCNILTSLLNAHLNNCPKINLPEFGGCPICFKQILMCNLEEHVNRCIEDNSSDDVENVELKQCEICTKYILLKEYNSHLQKCVVIDLSDCLNDDFDYVKCDSCNTFMDSDECNAHRNVCHKDQSELNVSYCRVCKTNIEQAIFTDHLINCSGKIDIDVGLASTSKEIETVSCLVCNKLIDKSKLELHLDECLVNTIEDIDEFDDEFNEDGKSVVSHRESAKMYNCPVCLKMLTVEQMDLHLDKCLNDN